MPEPQDTWVRDTLGIDPAGYAEAAGGAPPGQSQPPDMQGLDTDESILASVDLAFRELARQRKRLAQAGIDTRPLDTQIAAFQASRDKAKADPEHRRRHVSLENLRHDALRAALDAGDDAEAQLKSVGKGTTDAIADLCAAAAKQVEKVPKGKPRDILDQRLAFLQGWIKDVADEQDPKRRKLAIEDIDLEAQSLLKAAAKQTGDKKAVQAAFAEALKDKFGFDISNTIGTPNTHLDHIYALFEKMPVGHVAQSKLKELVYGPVKDGDALYDKAKITMTSFGAHPDDADYIDPAGPGGPTPSPQNSFDISALHELGHSIDDRWGIMKAHGSKPNCGAWNDESVDTVAEAVTKAFLVSPDGFMFRPTQDVAHAAILAALDRGTARKPAHIGDDDWKALHKVLDQCVDMRDGSRPWERPKDFGGRTYHEAGSGAWVSCDYAKRNDTGLTVRAYQWRSAAEFFAELYAFSWLKRQEPPGGVENAIKQYMFQKPK